MTQTASLTRGRGTERTFRCLDIYHIYLTISSQNDGVVIGLVLFPGILYFYDISSGLKKLVLEKVPQLVSENFEQSLGKCS